MTDSIKWSCSLSNGETLYENKGNFLKKEGELSPWRRLLLYLEKENLKITSLSLYSDDGKRWNLPSAGRNPKFKAFCDAPHPVSYKFFRKLGMDMDMGGGNRQEEIYAVVEADYGNNKIQVWVPEDNPNTCWSLII